MKQEQKKRRFGWRGFLLCLFGLIFLASTGVTAWVLLSHHKADVAIQELRDLARKSSVDSGETMAGADAALSEGEDVSDGDVQLPLDRQISMDFSELQQVNGDIIGWLYGEGTNIDYPVLRAEDNDYYLEHLYNGEVNANGSLFADFRNRGDFSDRNTVIYGHHMANGAMFGSLELYRDQDFYETVPTMMLYTPEGDYLVELISGTHENGYDDGFMSFEFESDEEFLQYVDSFRARSTFQSDVVVKPGDRLISLCTCAYVFDNARYMVIGRLVELYETEEADTQLP